LAGKLVGKQVCIQEPVGKLVLVGKLVCILALADKQVCRQVRVGKLAYLPEGKQVCMVPDILVCKVVHKQELDHSNGLDSLTKEAPKHSKEELRQKPQVYFSFYKTPFFYLRNWFIQIV
jgi:hypothetical protein